jgi:hypothetical protein
VCRTGRWKFWENPAVRQRLRAVSWLRSTVLAGRAVRATVTRLWGDAAAAAERLRRRAWTGTREMSQRLSAAVLPRAGSDDTLYFFYDLREHPVTYDVATQLVIAELERRARGLEKLHLVIVPGRWRFQDSYGMAVPPETTEMRIHHLAIPIAQFLRSCAGVTLCASRGQADWVRFALARHVYPPTYEPEFPERISPLARARAPGLAADTFFPMFRANPEMRRMVDTFLSERIGTRRPVVITLRQYGFMATRNSRVSNWVEFADGLDPGIFAPVFVPDTTQTLANLDPGVRRYTVCDPASFNVGLRMALYEAAYLNISLMHGPMELAIYNEACRYAVFIPVGVSPQTQEQLLRERGFSIGRDLPFARPWQRIVWEADELPAIRSTFAAMVQILDAPGSFGVSGATLADRQSPPTGFPSHETTFR